MASTVASSAVGSAQSLPLSSGSTPLSRSVPASAFLGINLKKSCASLASTSSKPFVVRASEDEEKQTKKDRWAGLAYDISDDQQDIARGKGMVDSLFQGAVGTGTQDVVMSSAEYLSTAQRFFKLDNMKDGFYIAPAFMDKLVVHVAKNFMSLPNIKVPLILGVWGGKGQGKSFQCELVFSKLGINPIMMSAGELESGNAGEPAKLIRQRYREAADIIRKKGQMCCLFINDLDAGAGRMGGSTQYTVNNQMVNATLMNIADNPTNVQLPGVYIKEELPRVPIIVTGNDFSTLYAPLIRDGRMEKFYWAPTRDDRIGVCKGIFQTDNLEAAGIVKLVDTFPGQSIDFFGALRARVYDDEVRRWIGDIGVENMGKKLVNSKEGPPAFQKPAMTVEKLLEYGFMLVNEQENVKRVQLAERYLKEAALGDANEDAMKQGTFYGGAAKKPIAEALEAKIPEAILHEVVEEKGAAIKPKIAIEDSVVVKAEEESGGVVVVEEEKVVVKEKPSVETAVVVEERVKEEPPITPPVVEYASPIVVKDDLEKKKADEGRELSRQVLTDAFRGIASTIISILKR